MDRRDATRSTEAARTCNCCGLVVYVGVVEPIGILARSDGKPSLILYQCPCNNTLAIPWAEAPEEMKERAKRAKNGPPGKDQ